MIDKANHERWRTAGYWRNLSMGQALAETAAAHPRATLTLHSSVRSGCHKLEDIHAQGCLIAGALKAIGIRPGDVVALQLPNWVEAALVWQAAASLGCVVLPIVSIYGETELEFILRDARARVLFVPRKLGRADPLERVRNLGSLPDLKEIVVVDGNGEQGMLDWNRFTTFAASIEPAIVAASDPAFLVYTSGTTAVPKGVLHSANSLLAEVRQMHLADCSDGPVLSPYPSGHVAGALGMLNHAAGGRDTHLFDSWNPEEAARVIEEERVTAMSGTPFHYLGLLDAADQNEHDLSSLTACGTGGASVPETLVRRASKSGLRLYRRYGMSEHPTVTQGQSSDSLKLRMTTDGRALPGVELRIVDDDGIDVLYGQEGEVVTRGPDMFLGYRDQAATAGALLPGGWFRSGDIGSIDSAGNLAITDRKKDIIIRGGENISSREVEEIMLKIEGVVEVAAIGMPDERLGERVCVFAALRPDFALEMPAIQQTFAEAGIARQKTPERLVLINHFPRTPAGKIRKADLRQKLKEGFYQ